MASVKHLLGIRRSLKLKLHVAAPAPRKASTLATLSNHLKQRLVKKPEEGEGHLDINKDDDEDEDDDGWIADNTNLQNGSPIRAPVAVSVAVVAADKAGQSSAVSARNAQLQLQPKQRPIEPITGQTYEMLILAVMSVSYVSIRYTILSNTHLPAPASCSTPFKFLEVFVCINDTNV